MNDNVLPFVIKDDVPPLVGMDVADLLDAVQAKEIASGVTLMTKDGFMIGNAIVIGETVAGSESMRQHLKDTNQRLWLIETDFGNRCKFTDREINDSFNLGYQRDYDSWRVARIDCIASSKRTDDEPT